MHAALRRAHVVGEGDDVLVVAVVILQRHLHRGVVLHAPHIDHIVVDGGLVLVEPGHILPDAALIAHGVRLLPALPAVKGGDFQAGVQKRLLLHPGVNGVVAVGSDVEHVRIGLEGDHGAGFVGGAHHPHGLGDVPSGEAHLVDFALLVNLNLQPLAEGVDHAGAHAVEAAGDLVAPAAELSAGVEDSKDHLQGGQAGLGLDVHGDAPAIIGDGDGVPLVDGDSDLIAEAGQGLVDGVIHNFIDQVVQTGFAGRANVHAGPFAHGLQPLQDLDLGPAVFVGHLGSAHFIDFRDVRHCKTSSV